MASSLPSTRSIGKLAALAGVKVPTIRFYEEIGLLPAPPRTASVSAQWAAVASAVNDAIRPLGIVVNSLPIKVARLGDMIAAAREK